MISDAQLIQQIIKVMNDWIVPDGIDGDAAMFLITELLDPYPQKENNEV